jgi:hypothetical protein
MWNSGYQSTNSGSNCKQSVNFTKCPEREAMSVASKTLVVYAPYVQRLNSRCRSSLFRQMKSDRLLLTDECRTVLSVCTMPVRCFCLLTSSTGPSLPIACRLLSLQYRYPPSWSCRCCLCLVASMTSVWSTCRLALKSAGPLVVVDVHTSLGGVFTVRFRSQHSSS